MFLEYKVQSTFCIHIECPLGYKDGNCEQPCEFPSFGEDCQKKCNCTHEICDHISGCMFESKISRYVFYIYKESVPVYSLIYHFLKTY